MQSRIERKDGKTYLVTTKSSLSEFWRELPEEQAPEEMKEPEPVKAVKKVAKKTAKKKVSSKKTK